MKYIHGILILFIILIIAYGTMPTYVTEMTLEKGFFDVEVVPVSLEEVIEEVEPIQVQDEIVILEETSTYIFEDTFEGQFVLEEVGEASRYSNPEWWLNSGAYFFYENGIGKTIEGRLEADDPGRSRYISKGERTDDGHRPQNIFRLITNEAFSNMVVETRFRVLATDTTNSVERAESNAVLLFGHYYDQDNLYYAGIRVDGQLMIKKKRKGSYTSLAFKPVFSGEWDKYDNLNLIPEGEWLQQKVTYQNIDDENVLILVELDTNDDGVFDYDLQVLDDGSWSGDPYIEEGFSGIRTDFMDVEFDYFRITSL